MNYCSTHFLSRMTAAWIISLPLLSLACGNLEFRKRRSSKAARSHYELTVRIDPAYLIQEATVRQSKALRSAWQLQGHPDRQIPETANSSTQNGENRLSEVIAYSRSKITNNGIQSLIKFLRIEITPIMKSDLQRSRSNSSTKPSTRTHVFPYSTSHSEYKINNLKLGFKTIKVTLLGNATTNQVLKQGDGLEPHHEIGDFQKDNYSILALGGLDITLVSSDSAANATPFVPFFIPAKSSK